MRVAYHKLVRDRIPAIIAADGGQPVTRVLDHAGDKAALRAKPLEEAHEAQAPPDGRLASELADVLEVLQALAATHDMGWEDVVSEASRKRAERGGVRLPDLPRIRRTNSVTSGRAPPGSDVNCGESSGSGADSDRREQVPRIVRKERTSAFADGQPGEDQNAAELDGDRTGYIQNQALVPVKAAPGALLASAECVCVLREHLRFGHLAVLSGGRG